MNHTMKLLLAGWLLLPQVFGVPKIIREVLETNTLYESWVSTERVWTGGELVLSNHISRHGYNVAGKVVKVCVEPSGAGMFRAGSLEGVSRADDESSYWETGDRPGPERMTENEREEKARRDTPFQEGDAVAAKTDLFGRVFFTFRPSSGILGPVNLRVYFVNQSTGFSEHVVLHRVEILDRKPFLLDSFSLLLLCLALPVGAFFAVRAVWRPEAPVLALLLYPWLAIVEGKRVSVSELRLWACVLFLYGLVVSAGLWFAPGSWWVALGAFPLFLLARNFTQRLGSGAVLLLASVFAQALFTAWVLRWSDSGQIQVLFSGSARSWALVPFVILLAPNPLSAFPLLTWAFKSGLLPWPQVAAALACIPVAYVFLEWRRRER